MSKSVDVRRSVGVIISNPNHHWQMVKPVIEELKVAEKIVPRLISLCGIRRMKDPVDDYRKLGIEYSLGPDLGKFGLKPNSGQQSLGSGNSKVRTIVHRLLWQVWFKRIIRRELRYLDAALVLNDRAFPMRHVVNEIKTQEKWFALLQEGIRFPNPNEVVDSYGSSEPNVLFAWGELSAEFFRERLANSRTKVIASGNPRYDRLLATDYSFAANDLRSRYNPTGPVIGLASNPIDDQSYCTNIEKLRLVKNFLAQSVKVLRGRGGQIWVKLHPRESISQFQQLANELKANDVIKVVDCSLIFPFLEAVDRVVVLASTVGLEALAMQRPLAVLPILGHGYVHDYVKQQAAIALELKDLDRQLNGWLDQDYGNLESAYVERHLANRGKAAKEIAHELIYAIN